MNSKIKALILLVSVVLFTEVFRLVKTARVNLKNKNNCQEQIYNKYIEKGYTRDYSKALAYVDCNKD